MTPARPLQPPLLASLEADRREGRKRLGVLLDPDKLVDRQLPELCRHLRASGVDVILFGGSLVGRPDLGELVSFIKTHTALPVVLFPGSVHQLVAEADAILFLSLISGRNPELLIGQQVQAAPRLRQLSLEVIATGYLLVDTGRMTAAQYVSATLPLPGHKPELAVATALAGQYLGLRAMYADAGSGAAEPISTELIAALREALTVPLIIGGGIRTPEQVTAALEAGADLVVVGTAVEEDARPERLSELVAAAHRVVAVSR